MSVLDEIVREFDDLFLLKFDCNVSLVMLYTFLIRKKACKVVSYTCDVC